MIDTKYLPNLITDTQTHTHTYTLFFVVVVFSIFDIFDNRFKIFFLFFQLQIFMNQFTDMSDKDLLVIRLASLNQILDPWVYILIRRNTVYYVSRLFRWVFRMKRPSFLQRSSSLTLRRASSESKSSISKMASLDSRNISFENHTSNNNNKDDISWAEFCWNCMCENPADKYDYNAALSSSRSDISKHHISAIIKTPELNGEISRIWIITFFRFYNFNLFTGG